LAVAAALVAALLSFLVICDLSQLAAHIYLVC
jgi:hypothetical protein